MIGWKGKPSIMWRWMSFVNHWLFVDITASIIVTLVMGLPFLLYSIWAIVLWAAPSLDNHIGFAVFFLLGGFHLIVLSGVVWWKRKWRLSGAIIISFVLAIIFLFGYLISVIFIPDYFSYTGTTSVFLCMTFIFISIAHFEVDHLRNRVSMSVFVRKMEENPE